MTSNDVPPHAAMDDYQKRFMVVMKERGLHITRQRLSIARMLHALRGHPSIDEVHAELKKTEPDVGLTTVYRTLRLLKDAGLAMELRGKEGTVRFEAVREPKRHAHLVCRHCGSVREICSRELEEARSALARQYAFSPEEEAHCIYGLCPACFSGPGTVP
jgi:Fur family ferric uptake transcriptional regulator